MRFIKSSLIVAALCVAGAAGAAAAEKTAASCRAADAQVSAALEGAQQNDDARKEKSKGFQACNSGFYQVGMAHYAKAMQLLGSTLAQN